MEKWKNLKSKYENLINLLKVRQSINK
jgi:hypothetical protein